MKSARAPKADKTEPVEPSPQELVELARAYAEAAEQLVERQKKCTAISRAPYRLAAIHAIELYLNAYLRMKNHEPDEIRGLQHDLQQRTERATKAGMKLRKRTITHLGAMTSNREYLLARYQPSAQKSLSQINRLLATLRDVEKKVTTAMEQDNPSVVR